MESWFSICRLILAWSGEFCEYIPTTVDVMNKVAICAHPSKKNLTWLINFYFKNHPFFYIKKGDFVCLFWEKTCLTSIQMTLSFKIQMVKLFFMTMLMLRFSCKNCQFLVIRLITPSTSQLYLLDIWNFVTFFSYSQTVHTKVEYFFWRLTSQRTILSSLQRQVVFSCFEVLDFYLVNLKTLQFYKGNFS